MKIRHLAAAAAITLSLTACDNSNAKWEAQSGTCLSLSSEGNFTAMVTPKVVAFIAVESGCPDDMGLLGIRQASVRVGGDRYPAILTCGARSNDHSMFILGKLVRNDTTSGPELGDRAVKAITGFFGAKVTLDGEIAHFGKGNFAKVCSAYIPHPGGEKTASHSKGFLSSLFGGKKAPEQGVDNAMRDKFAADSNAAFARADAANQKQGKDDKTSSANTASLGAMNFTNSTGRPGGGLPASDLPGDSAAVGKPQQVQSSNVAPLTPEAEATALKNAQSTYLIYHPGTDISAFTWQKSPLPDKSVNGATVHVLRFTTTNSQTNVTTDVDVEINPDGSAGYATNNDRPTPVATSASVDPVNAYCTLDNGKNVNVYAANGQDYRYSYLDKNNQSELELTEGLFGVKAFHYETQLGMGKAQYIRFNKKQYDYVLLSLDTGKREFYGIRVYKDGSLISSHTCKTRLNLDVSPLTDAAHADSDKMGDFVTN
ncbi:TPA: hypothetical protein QHU17_004000 [Enterobacter hormaechei subsp. xiangfangensis]|nr:hypothetical protein [Enterobacter hormaechei subsp. xiangfangensis]